jgi:hypothetical protein
MRRRAHCAYSAVFVAGFILLLSFFQTLSASKLVEVKVVDKDYLQVCFKDGDVTFVDDGLGSTAFLNLAHDVSNNVLVNYGTALNTANAVANSSWKLTSTDDAAYGTAGLAPVSCYRKSKLNGMFEGDWSGSDFVYSHTMEHSVYLRLPGSMVQGKTYTLRINANTNTDSTSKTFTYDIYNSRSEAASRHTKRMGVKKLSNGNFRITPSLSDGRTCVVIKLLNCSGRVVREIRTQNIPAEGLVLETSSLSKGIYLLEMTQAGERTLNKLSIF